MLTTMLSLPAMLSPSAHGPGAAPGQVSVAGRDRSEDKEPTLLSAWPDNVVDDAAALGKVDEVQLRRDLVTKSAEVALGKRVKARLTPVHPRGSSILQPSIVCSYASGPPAQIKAPPPSIQPSRPSFFHLSASSGVGALGPHPLQPRT